MTGDESKQDEGRTLGQILAAQIEVIDRELAEIEMLANQVKSEAARHEARRAQTADRVGSATANPTTPALKEVVDSYNALITMTRRAVLMEAQAELLEAKGKALARHRASLVAIGEATTAEAARQAILPVPLRLPAAADAEGALPPSLSRVVLSAQEDLRRDIARSMHDGPAQSLTNIVLQAQIVERLMDRDPAAARGELRLLATMVQSTLDTTKNFIFDVRPMVLDDLGLVPTLRRSTRERGRRAHVAVEFESHGQDRRLPMELESGLFRLLDEVLVAFLAAAPERLSLSLEWGADDLLASVLASRAPVYPSDEPLPPVPQGDVPDTMRRMIQERHDAHETAIAEAEAAALVPVPPGVRRSIVERAAAIGAELEALEAGEVRMRVPLPAEDSPASR